MISSVIQVYNAGLMYTVGPCLLNIQFIIQWMPNNQTGKIIWYWTMIQETSFSVDSPPSYAEAMEYVQLSPRQLIQVMVDQQCNNRQTNNALADNDQEIFMQKIKGLRRITKLVIIIQLAVFLFLIFVIICITCL